MRAVDITGQRFGSLVAIRRCGSNAHGHAAWECRCDCGTLTYPAAGTLRAGVTNSCGCQRGGRARHGHNRKGPGGRSRTYVSWAGMCDRCRSPANHKWPRYGGRGIRVCDRWLTFDAFLADMGERPSRAHSIDRLDNDGNYEPANCRWATVAEQARNKSATRRFSLNGEHLCRAELARRLGLRDFVPEKRIRRGHNLLAVFL